MKRGCAYVNPLQLKIPGGAPVPPGWRQDFLEKIGPVRARIDLKPVA